MTRTSAQDYVDSMIFMTAVDTGWINVRYASHPHCRRRSSVYPPAAAQKSPSQRLPSVLCLLFHQDENPLPKAAQIAKDYNFQTPLDEVDAAMRVLDPILAPLAEIQEHNKAGKKPPLQLRKMKIPFGYFIKDYMKCEW